MSRRRFPSILALGTAVSLSAASAATASATGAQQQSVLQPARPSPSRPRQAPRCSASACRPAGLAPVQRFGRAAAPRLRSRPTSTPRRRVRTSARAAPRPTASPRRRSRPPGSTWSKPGTMPRASSQLPFPDVEGRGDWVRVLEQRRRIVQRRGRGAERELRQASVRGRPQRRGVGSRGAIPTSTSRSLYPSVSSAPSNDIALDACRVTGSGSAAQHPLQPADRGRREHAVQQLLGLLLLQLPGQGLPVDRPDPRPAVRDLHGVRTDARHEQLQRPGRTGGV